MATPRASLTKLERRAPQRLSSWNRITILARNSLIFLRAAYLRNILGMDVDLDTQISLKAHLDKTNPSGIHVGPGTLIAFGAVVLSHDMARALTTDTYIGSNCFVGAHSIILPGIRIGNNSIVATGSVVTSDVAPNTIVAGNPARVIRTGISTRKWGVLEDAYLEAVLVQAESDAARISRST